VASAADTVARTDGYFFDCKRSDVVVAAVVIMVTVVLLLGIRTRTFSTFPFAGLAAALIIGP